MCFLFLAQEITKLSCIQINLENPPLSGTLNINNRDLNQCSCRKGNLHQQLGLDTYFFDFISLCSNSSEKCVAYNRTERRVFQS